MILRKWRHRETGAETTTRLDTPLDDVLASSGTWAVVAVDGLAVESVLEEAPQPEPTMVQEYDPDLPGRTVDQVNVYLARHPSQVKAVLQREAEGKARIGILHGPHGTPLPST